MREICVNRDFPVSSRDISICQAKAISYGYDPSNKDTLKRLRIPDNPCEVYLLGEYLELQNIWETYKPKLKAVYDKLTDNKGKGAPTKGWLELDAIYIMCLYDSCLELYPDEAFNQVAKYLNKQLTIFNK